MKNALDLEMYKLYEKIGIHGFLILRYMYTKITI